MKLRLKTMESFILQLAIWKTAIQCRNLEVMAFLQLIMLPVFNQIIISSISKKSVDRNSNSNNKSYHISNRTISNNNISSKSFRRKKVFILNQIPISWRWSIRICVKMMASSMVKDKSTEIITITLIINRSINSWTITLEVWCFRIINNNNNSSNISNTCLSSTIPRMKKMMNMGTKIIMNTVMNTSSNRWMRLCHRVNMEIT